MLIFPKRKSSCSLLGQEGLRAEGRSCVPRGLESKLEKSRKAKEVGANTRGQISPSVEEAEKEKTFLEWDFRPEKVKDPNNNNKTPRSHQHS